MYVYIPYLLDVFRLRAAEQNRSHSTQIDVFQLETMGCMLLRKLVSATIYGIERNQCLDHHVTIIISLTVSYHCYQSIYSSTQ